MLRLNGNRRTHTTHPSTDVVTPNAGRFGPHPRAYTTASPATAGPVRWPCDTDDVLVQDAQAPAVLNHADPRQRLRHTAHQPDPADASRPACEEQLVDPDGRWLRIAAGHLRPINAVLCSQPSCFGGWSR